MLILRYLQLDNEFLTLEDSWRELERVEGFVWKVRGGIEEAYP